MANEDNNKMGLDSIAGNGNDRPVAAQPPAPGVSEVMTKTRSKGTAGKNKGGLIRPSTEAGLKELEGIVPKEARKIRKIYDESPEGAPLVQWQAKEFKQYRKTTTWYIIGGIIAAAIIAYALVTQGYLMALTVFILTMVVYMYTIKRPETISISVKTRGIRIGEQYIPYERLNSFWFFYNPPEVKTLNFQGKDLLRGYITVQLGNQDPDPVREALLMYLPEDIEREESFADRISRRLKI